MKRLKDYAAKVKIEKEDERKTVKELEGEFTRLADAEAALGVLQTHVQGIPRVPARSLVAAEKVQALIDARADLEKRTSEGKTALMWAYQRGHDQCARALIEANADLHKHD